MALNLKEVRERKRWSAIKRKYGLTKEQWFEILRSQDGLCFICSRKLKIRGKSTRNLAHTDHCHYSGRVRGILCGGCNTGLIPMFEKDPPSALKLYEYLTRSTNYGYVPEGK